MTEEQREKEFPIHIELGHEAESFDMSNKGTKEGQEAHHLSHAVHWQCGWD